MTKEETYEISFNTKFETPKERAEKLLEVGILYSPFEEGVRDKVMTNPFTMETINGVLENGEHTFHQAFTCKVWRKILVENHIVVKAWEVVNDEEWVEIFKQDDERGWWELNKETTT